MMTKYQKFLAQSAARRARAKRLRAQGKTMHEIGKIMGITRQRASQLCRP
jgi:DNA-directed RNA polymerase sigma subunit (sigma70/sigma32)